MRILITGAAGFVGGHLAEHLLAAGHHEVVGLGRKGEWPVDLRHLTTRVPLRTVDLLDGAATEATLKNLRPEWVFHLAGYANTGKSFTQPGPCWADNLDATRTLYDALGRAGLTPRVVFASTGLIYGDPDEPGTPCDERTTLKPASPYAASKAAADVMSYQYARTAGLDVVRVRLFNQTGPRQPTDYAIANFARQIAAAEAGKQPPVMETGDLSAERDVTDVRDMVAALAALADKGVAGEAYNAGRGETFRIQELLDRLLRQSKVRVDVRQRVDPGRKADTAVTRADAGKLRRATGWAPRVPIDQTLGDTLDYWRGVAARG